MTHSGKKSLVVFALVYLITGGCNSSDEAAYIPSEDAGRQAVEAALSAWQNGKPMARIEGQGAPAVQPQDSDWKSGKKLASFAVTKELPTTEGPKQFAVQLTLQGAAQPIDTVYFVVGRDPLWVFRDRDYKATTGM